MSFSHPGRCRSDAAFAALAGTSPLQASSGRTVRHRLNRGGDRALNRAIHTIAMTRMRSCPRTQAYVARRTAEGKTTREIRRCLKRYIARELYRTLTATMTPQRLQLRRLDKNRSVRRLGVGRRSWAGELTDCGECLMAANAAGLALVDVDGPGSTLWA